MWRVYPVTIFMTTKSNRQSLFLSLFSLALHRFLSTSTFTHTYMNMFTWSDRDEDPEKNYQPRYTISTHTHTHTHTHIEDFNWDERQRKEQKENRSDHEVVRLEYFGFGPGELLRQWAHLKQHLNVYRQGRQNILSSPIDILCFHHWTRIKECLKL